MLDCLQSTNITCSLDRHRLPLDVLPTTLTRQYFIRAFNTNVQTCVARIMLVISPKQRSFHHIRRCLSTTAVICIVATHRQKKNEMWTTSWQHVLIAAQRHKLVSLIEFTCSFVAWSHTGICLRCTATCLGHFNDEPPPLKCAQEQQEAGVSQCATKLFVVEVGGCMFVFVFVRLVNWLFFSPFHAET